MNLRRNEVYKDPSKLAEATDLATDLYGEIQELPINKEQSNTVDAIDTILERDKSGKDTFLLPDGRSIERSYKQINDKRSESAKRYINNK